MVVRMETRACDEGTDCRAFTWDDWAHSNMSRESPAIGKTKIFNKNEPAAPKTRRPAV